MAINIQTLGRAIKQLQYQHHRRLDAALRRIGSSLAQWDALRAIGSTPNASGHALAEATFQTDQSFGGLATRMIGKGLVIREPGIGRALQYRLSPEGERLSAEGAEIAEGILSESFRSLTDAEREQLLALIDKAIADDGADDKV